MHWLLVSEPGKIGCRLIFRHFRYGTEDFEESGPEMETSGRDLDFGGNVAGRKRKI